MGKIVAGVVLVGLALWIATALLWPTMVSVWLGGDETYHERLRWRDPGSGLTFVAEDRAGAIVHTFTRLSVIDGSSVRRVQLDDDAPFGLLEFVRFGGWLLVVSDGQVFGGYEYGSRRLVGENRWRELPFTVRTHAGDVVAEIRVGEQGSTPAGFPRIEERP